MKVLSVIVPVYNTERYLRRCLDSLVYHDELLKFIDIIVVDDGSTDDVLKIAREYEHSYPGSFQVIKKENGGHGSTINVGMKLAKGKYVKILDSDDWVNINDFSEFVKKLKDEDSDIIVTNYRRELVYDESEVVFLFSDSTQEKKMELCTAVSEINEPGFFFKFSMPSMTIRKDSLETVWGDGLLEHTFYVDQQFVAKVLMAASTYKIYDLDIYRHYIGRPGQSIGKEGFYKHRSDHEKVLKELLKMYEEISDEKKKILKKQIDLMLDTHYSIYDGKKHREILVFDNYLKKNYSGFYKKKRISEIKREVIRRRK